MRKHGALLVLTALLAGCSTTPAENSALKAEYEATIPVCMEERDCERMWAAARRWIVDNAAYRLQHVTDDYLATYNPRQNHPNIAFRASREPTDAGYRIVGEAWCANMFGCVPGRYEAMVDFNRTVAAAAE